MRDQAQDWKLSLLDENVSLLFWSVEQKALCGKEKTLVRSADKWNRATKFGVGRESDHIFGVFITENNQTNTERVPKVLIIFIRIGRRVMDDLQERPSKHVWLGHKRLKVLARREVTDDNFGERAVKDKVNSNDHWVVKTVLTVLHVVQREAALVFVAGGEKELDRACG